MVFPGLYAHRACSDKTFAPALSIVLCLPAVTLMLRQKIVLGQRFRGFITPEIERGEG